MGCKKTSGLFKKQNIWQIDKQIFGRRIRMTTGTDNLREAELILARVIENTRQMLIFGKRPVHYFEEARVRYLKEKQGKASLCEDTRELKNLGVFFDKKPLEAIHMGSLQPFIDERKRKGVRQRTINKALQIIRHLLNLAASEWLNEDGRPWLEHAPKIRLLDEHDSREPYPLSWDEQDWLFGYLPKHYRQMALFKVNTGCRMQEVCRLRWEWETFIPELGTSVFLIPKQSIVNGQLRRNVKNGDHRLVILNHVAKSVIEEVRGLHPTFVFTYLYQGARRPLTTMNKYTWQRARDLAELPYARIHDLKHTFGRRLRAAGVGFEDRQDLLGHKSARITTHYSRAEIRNLIEAANKVCRAQASDVNFTLLRAKTPTISPPLIKGSVVVDA